MQWHATCRFLLLLVTATVGLSVLADAQAQTVLSFGDAKGEVTVPASYERVASQDASLVVATKPHENVVLFFDLHAIENPPQNGFGEAVVREIAKKKNRKLRELPDRVVFIDSSDDSLINGRQFANLHWQIGFGNTVVVMSALIARDAAEAPDVKQFFSGDVDKIIESLRRVNP